MTLLFRIHTIFLLTLLAALIACFTSCDSTFEPMQENNQYHFSVYGYLDVSADTQWVRVTPVRDQLRPTGEPLDATVTLENLSNGETIVMNDSLIQTLGETVPVVWTTEEILPDTPYRFRIESDTKSQADIHMPKEIPNPKVFITPDSTFRAHELYVEPVERFVDAHAIYCVRVHGAPEEDFLIFSIPIKEYHERTNEGFPNRYRVDVRNVEPYLRSKLVIHPRARLDSRYDIRRRQLIVHISNTPWPEFDSIDLFEQEIPDGSVSNIENGVGFLGGLISKTVPFKTCYDENNEWIACELEAPILSPLECLYEGNSSLH